MRNHQPRRGFTLLELLVVLAMLIILAAVTIPSFSGLKGNTDQKAAADIVRARIADARSRAMEDGVPYRLAVNSEGTKIRLAPDSGDFADMPAEGSSGAAKVTEDTLEKATAGVSVEGDDPPPETDQAGWVTIATFLPDGTCREDNVILEVRETGFPPIRIRIRGVIGSSRVLPTTTPGTNGGMK